MDKSVVFVDCFDTIVKRKVSPNEIKYLWALKMSGKYQMSADKFFRLFLACENYLVQTAIKNNDEGEWSFEELIELMFNTIILYKIMPLIDKHVFVQNCKNFYNEVECENQYVNLKIKKIIAKYKNEGKKIYLISDFYCGKEYFKQWFYNLGIIDLFDDLYVSCDLKKSKKHGSIYPYVLSQLNISSKDVLMIGDNVFSDCIQAKKCGLMTKRVYTIRKNYKLNSEFRNFKCTKMDKNYIKIYKKNKGYSNYAFSLYSFIMTLYEKIKNSGIKSVFFLSREGEFLKRLFDYYLYRQNDTEIKSYYLQMSRNSILVASLNELNDEDFATVLREKRSISIREFLSTLQFDKNIIDEIHDKIRYDIDKQIVDFLKSEEYNALINDNQFIECYNYNRQVQACAFHNYIDSFGVDITNNDLSIVDVGWKGTMQDLLFKFFKGQVCIHGYYLGLTHPVNICKNNIKEGLLYSVYPFYPDFVDKLFGIKIINFEQILKATHNRVVGYEVIKDRVIVKYDNANDESKYYDKLFKPLQDSIFEKFKNICDVTYGNNDNIRMLCAKMHFKMIMRTGIKDYKWLIAALNTHYDSFARIGVENKDKYNIKRYCKFKLSNLKYYIKLRFKNIL